MGMYDALEIFSKRSEAKKEDRDLIYKCFWCKSDINLNDNHSPDTFRDDISYREFLISGLCQKCQDGVFGKKDAFDVFIRCPETFKIHDITFKCDLRKGHSGQCMSLPEGEDKIATVMWNKSNFLKKYLKGVD